MGILDTVTLGAISFSKGTRAFTDSLWRAWDWITGGWFPLLHAIGWDSCVCGHCTKETTKSKKIIEKILLDFHSQVRFYFTGAYIIHHIQENIQSSLKAMAIRGADYQGRELNPPPIYFKTGEYFALFEATSTALTWMKKLGRTKSWT